MSLMTADLSNQIPTVLIMLGIICLIGIFGNTLVIIVYSLKQDRLTATLFILILAISDFLACITLIPGTMIIEYVEWNIDSTFLCKFYYFINNTFIPFSSLLISCIAFDRYFCLCHPFKNILTRERAKRVILILIFICIILGFSSTFTVRVEQVHFDTNIINNNDNNNNNRHSNKTIDYNSTIKFDYSFNSYYKSEKFECTEILKLNHTMIETVLYQIVQKSQTCSYILCILCVVTLYILIYRSVSKVSLIFCLFVCFFHFDNIIFCLLYEWCLPLGFIEVFL
uniref:Orexin receptor type 2 n=1 Tax=Schistosoma haematobium TaxID=6185 RepID=A0A094ZJF0_SCHHA